MVRDDGVELHVRLTPRGGRDAIDGIETLADGRKVLKARVRAVPEDGKANQALIKLIAEFCSCPSSSVSLIAGATARIKTLFIAGDGPRLAERLKAGPDQ